VYWQLRFVAFTTSPSASQDAGGFCLNRRIFSLQPRPDVADPEPRSAVEHDNRRRLTVPSPSFDGHRRPTREQANLKIVEQRVVAQSIEHEPDVGITRLASGRHLSRLRGRIDFAKDPNVGAASQQEIARFEDLKPGVDRPENVVDPVTIGQITDRMQRPDCFGGGANKSLASVERVLEHRALLPSGLPSGKGCARG
jgi:hypothetical protein